MSTRFNDQWALLGTRWSGKTDRGRGVRPNGGAPPGLGPAHDPAAERPKSAPPPTGARRPRRPRWIDRDT